MDQKDESMLTWSNGNSNLTYKPLLYCSFTEIQSPKTCIYLFVAVIQIGTQKPEGLSPKDFLLHQALFSKFQNKGNLYFRVYKHLEVNLIIQGLSKTLAVITIATL